MVPPPPQLPSIDFADANPNAAAVSAMPSPPRRCATYASRSHHSQSLPRCRPPGLTFERPLPSLTDERNRTPAADEELRWPRTTQNKALLRPIEPLVASTNALGETERSHAQPGGQLARLSRRSRLSYSRARSFALRSVPRVQGAALQAMITDESLTVSEAGQWCAGAIGHREAARLRGGRRAGHNNDGPRTIARWPPTFDDGAHKYCRRTWSFGAVASTRRLCENARQSQAASWRAASSFPLVNYLPVARRARA